MTGGEQFQPSEESSRQWREGDREPGQAAAGKERGGRRRAKKASWDGDTRDGVRRRGGENNSAAEVDRIRKDPETLKGECRESQEGTYRGHNGLYPSLRGQGVAGDSGLAGRGVARTAALWRHRKSPVRWRCPVNSLYTAFLFYPINSVRRDD